MDTILRGLNAAQRAAVTSKASVLQCLAPPGSGKTKTLTSRVAYLVSSGYAPQSIICCTFTIKAAREMRERLRGLVGNDLEKRLILGTFHSICRRYLVTYGHLIGIPTNFGIADTNDSLGILKRLQKEIKFGLDPKVARNKISHRKARGQTVEDVRKSTKTKSTDAQEFITIFQEYETALATSNLLDYDDLLVKCVELLSKHPECVSNIEALLIDEFQDTNVVQFNLMKLLASARKRITIVGDPDQSIYGFRSAEIENLQRMKDYYPDTVVINLEENYRSSSAILKLAQDVIEQDDDRPAKKLKSTHSYGTLPVLRRLPNPYEEANWIVSEIKRVTTLSSGCVEFSDIAILLRSAFLSLLIEKSLAKDGIPYKMVGGRRFFDRVEVRTILDYLRTINHPDNNSALLSIINVPSRKIGEAGLAELNRAAEKSKLSLWATIQKVLSGDVKLAKKLMKPAELGLRELVELIRKGQERLVSFEPAQAPGKLIELVADTLNFRGHLQKEYSEDWQERWENVKELSIQAKDVNLQNLTDDDQLPEIDGVRQDKIAGSQEVLTRFLANVALSTEVEAEDEGEQKPRITISTIHSAKGLEWPVVFIPAVYEGSIPHSRAEDSNEERRLLYVAMTRAKALLYMTFPVLQSRGESESILTQFLPTSINTRIQDTGPVINDQTIRDIANILGRQTPSQESLAKAVVGLKEEESQYDDIWPADGSPKIRPFDNDRISGDFYLQRGRSMADALQINTTTHQQRSSYSTFSGFTTANVQMSRTPIQEQQLNAVEEKEKPKLIKSTSLQGSIASFFQQRGSNPEQKENIAKQQSALRAHSDESAIPRKSMPSIPSELSSHRLNKALLHNPATSMKRPRAALVETSNLDQRMPKKAYTCFSSSPGEPTSTENAQIVVGGGVQGPPPKPKYTTSIIALSSGVQQQQQGPNFISYNNSMLDRLKPMTKLSSMRDSSTSGAPRKTLGVRRGVNSGWNERKIR